MRWRPIAVLELHGTKVAEAVEDACRGVPWRRVKVLVAAVVEAFVNAKLEHTAISTALYAASSEPEGAAVVRGKPRPMRAIPTAPADAHAVAGAVP